MNAAESPGGRPDVEAILAEIRKKQAGRDLPPEPEIARAGTSAPDASPPAPAACGDDKPWCPFTIARKVLRRVPGLRNLYHRMQGRPAPAPPSAPAEPGRELEARIQALIAEIGGQS